MTKEIVKAEETKAISREGDMYSRLKYMITNGRKLNNDECAALAQFAVVEGLNPFAQECWYIPRVGPAIGILGLRKKATQALGNGYTWNVQFRDVTDDYRNTEDQTVKWAFEATLRDTKSMKDYMEVYEKAKGLFETAEEIIAAVGRPPIWQAVGIFLEAQADKYKDKFFAQKERAKKRAEALVIKKRFSLSYDYGEADYVEEKALTIGFEKEAERINVEAETIEADMVEVVNTEKNALEGEIVAEKAKTEPTERPGWTSEQIMAVVDKYEDVHGKQAVERMNKSKHLSRDTAIPVLLKWMRVYQVECDGGAESQTAATEADLKVFG